MNAVTVATAVEPYLVTTVTNNTNTRGSATTGNRGQPRMVVANSYSAGVPTLVTNGVIGRGRTNPAGPQVEEEEKMERGMIGGEDNCMNLLNFSPDEHEPLLTSEQPPAESEPLPHPHHHQSRPGSILTGRGTNSNNNNNRIASGSGVKIQGSPKPEPHLAGQQISESGPTPQVPPIGQGSEDTGPCVQRTLCTKPVLTPRPTRSPKAHLVQFTASPPVPGCSNPDSGSASPVSQAQEPATKTLTSQAQDPLILAPENQPLKAPGPDPTDPEAPEPEKTVVLSQDPETTTLAEASTPEPAALQSRASDPTPAQLRPQMGPTKAKRPVRPSSLDLSSSCISSGEPTLFSLHISFVIYCRVRGLYSYLTRQWYSC